MIENRLNLKERLRIDRFIENSSTENSSINPSTISKGTNIALEKIIERLNELIIDNKVSAVYGFDCPFCNRYMEASIESNEIHESNLRKCPNCEREFRVRKEDVWVSYYRKNQSKNKR